MTGLYLDHNASTPLRPEARAAMIEALDVAGNPSSLHGEGRAARKLVDDAREKIAALLGAKPSQVFFTSGATEAANWLTGAFGHARNGKVFLPSAVEHVAVLHGHSFHAADVTEIGADANGLVRLDALQLALAGSHEDALVAVQAANNETGVIQPVRDVAAVARDAGAHFVCDAVQAIGRMPLDALTAADAYFVSAHKFGGPKGVGAAIIHKDSFRPKPLIVGGGQEFRQRSGTENVIGIAGMAAALAAAMADAAAFAERAGEMQQRLEAGLRDIAPDTVIFGAGARRLTNTTCFAVPGLSAETLLIAFDLAGIAVSSGSACSSGKVSPSHVLAAMGVPRELARSAIRVSTGWTTASADIERFLETWAQIYRRMGARAAA